MSAIDPFSRDTATNTPPVAQALHQVRNPDPPYLDCLCGRCLAGERIGFANFALDACMRAAMDRVTAMKDRDVERDADDRLTLHALAGLISRARMLLCLQRVAFRE